MSLVTRKAVLAMAVGLAATVLVLVSLSRSNSQAATPVGNSTTDWFPAINNTWPLCGETATISNVTLTQVTSTTAAVSWQTTPAARTCLDLDSDIQPVFTSPQPISQAFQGVAYAPGEYSNNLAWWGERVTDTIVSDVERIAAANFNAIVLYPAGPLHGAIHPWDQIVFTTAAAHGLKIAFRLEWVPSPFDWGPEYGWSYFKLLHKDEAGWGLIDRRRLDDRPITTTHHLTLTDLFPATRYTLTLRAGDTVSGPYTFTTVAAPTPTDVSPLLTITKPPYGHELVPPGGQLTIRWKADDPDDNATIRLYYDANDAGCDGTLIVGNLAEHSTTGTYTWTLPSTLPTGSFYIYGQISDGTNPVECDYSSGQFVPSTETLGVLPLCGSITVDGVMDEPIWQHATPLTYAIHVSQTDKTTATARALWDQDYLYLGFEVQDSQVETADLDWNDDSVSLIFNNGEFRCRQDVGGTGEGECKRALYLPPCTTLDQPGDSDCGYAVEMRIRWSQARITAHAGDLVPTDLLSVDHDGAPGAPYTATEFSKLSWDGDGSVDTTGRSLTLVSRCGQCRCVWLPIVLKAWR